MSEAQAVQTDSERFIESLEKVIQIYRTHPDISVPWIGDMNVFVHDKTELFSVAKTFGLKTRLGSEWAEVRMDIGNGNSLVFNMRRTELCERKQVGTRTVTRDKVETKVIGQETVEEPIYKWVCPPDLGVEEQKP